MSACASDMNQSPVVMRGKPVKGMSMLAVIVTILVVLAALAILLMNGPCTGFFFNRPPQGSDAMGLIVPVVGLAGGVLVMTIAAILAAFRANSAALGLLHSSPVASGLMIVVLAFGASLAAGMAFMLWCDPISVGKGLRAAQIYVGLGAGILGPIVVAVAMLIGVWMDKSSASAHIAAGGANGMALRALPWICGLLALVGYGLGGSMLWNGVQQQVANTAARWKLDNEVENARRAHMSKPVQDRVADELKEFSPDAPLWSIVAYLPDKPDEESLNDKARKIVVQRILSVPNLNDQLQECMKSRYYLYRQGAAEFLIHVPQEAFEAQKEQWGAALVIGLRETGDGIACRPAWMKETFDLKPDPLGHVRTLLLASERFRGWSGYPQMQDALKQMAGDAALLTQDKHQGKLLHLLSEHGYVPSPANPPSPR